MEEFFEIGLPDNVVAETYHKMYGYRFRCVKRIINYKTDTRWYCMKEGRGDTLPEYIREAPKRSGFKTLPNFFAMLGYFRMTRHYSTSYNKFTSQKTLI